MFTNTPDTTPEPSPGDDRVPEPNADETPAAEGPGADTIADDTQVDWGSKAVGAGLRIGGAHLAVDNGLMSEYEQTLVNTESFQLNHSATETAHESVNHELSGRLKLASGEIQSDSLVNDGRLNLDGFSQDGGFRAGYSVDSEVGVSVDSDKWDQVGVTASAGVEGEAAIGNPEKAGEAFGKVTAGVDAWYASNALNPEGEYVESASGAEVNAQAIAGYTTPSGNSTVYGGMEYHGVYGMTGDESMTHEQVNAIVGGSHTLENGARVEGGVRYDVESREATPFVGGSITLEQLGDIFRR